MSEHSRINIRCLTAADMQPVKTGLFVDEALAFQHDQPMEEIAQLPDLSDQFTELGNRRFEQVANPIHEQLQKFRVDVEELTSSFREDPSFSELGKGLFRRRQAEQDLTEEYGPRLAGLLATAHLLLKTNPTIGIVARIQALLQGSQAYKVCRHYSTAIQWESRLAVLAEAIGLPPDDNEHNHDSMLDKIEEDDDRRGDA